MEEKNEYGNCWEDLEKRMDMENRHADRVLKQWAEEDQVDNNIGEEAHERGPLGK